MLFILVNIMMNYLRILVIGFVCCACTSNPVGSKSVLNNNQQSKEMGIQEVSVRSFTRGYRSAVIVTKGKVVVSENEKSITKELTLEQWDGLLALINKISLSDLAGFSPPSTAHHSDGALAEALTIKTKDETFVTQPYDDNNPPEEIAEIVNLLHSFLEKK